MFKHSPVTLFEMKINSSYVFISIVEVLLNKHSFCQIYFSSLNFFIINGMGPCITYSHTVNTMWGGVGGGVRAKERDIF